MRGKVRDDLALNALQLVIRVGARKIEKDAAHAFKQTAAFLKCRDCVGECGPSRLPGDLRDLLFVGGHRILECRGEVTGHDLVEGRDAEWRRPPAKQGIGNDVRTLRLACSR